MKSNIENDYLEALWKEIQDKNYFLYSLDSYYRFNVIKKSDYNLLSTPGFHNNVEKIHHKKAISENIVVEKSFFLSEFKKEKIWLINGLENFNDFLINFYLSLSINKRKHISSILNKVSNDKRFDFFSMNQLLYSKLELEEFNIWWKSLPKNIVKVGNYSSELETIVEFIIKNIPLSVQHEYLSVFINKRASIVNRSEQKSLSIRDMLISFYKDKTNLLADYIDYIPSIKMYLQSTLNSNYLEERFIKESFYIEVNFEKLKAVIAIPGWTNATYEKWINALMDVLYQEYDEIKNIKKFNERESYQKQEYLSIYISKHTTDGISKEVIENYIRELFKFLHYNYSSIDNLQFKTINYVKKWYLLQKLNVNLEVSEIIKKVEKI